MVTDVNASKKKAPESKGKDAQEKSPKSKEKDGPPPQTNRETVESIVVAFILAFLFRAFVAEAFVIPTGSMAPTLMGAHKDLICEVCGEQYQASASSEFDELGALKKDKTIASNCSNCRALNAYDFVNNVNHATFSGDRILVSKFDYVLFKPERWDVIVFKYPLEAHMNYIKRLIGLPGETLKITEGDVYVQQEGGAWNMARKPPHKIQAMKQLVHNSENVPAELVAAGWPSPWQPWTESASGTQWQVAMDEESWSAALPASPSQQWLRYYHKFPNNQQWDDLLNGTSIPTPDPRSSQLITDYVAYNSSFLLSDASTLFNLEKSGFGGLPFVGSGPSWKPNESWRDDQRAWQAAKDSSVSWALGTLESQNGNDGFHWVGDLSGRFEVDVESESGTLMLDLVEFGIHFRCSIDVATGQATLQGLEGSTELPLFEGATSLSGTTSVRGTGSYKIEFANIDDQLVLWVNQKAVQFDKPTTFDSQTIRKGNSRRPYWTAADPLDAAPVGIGGVGLGLKVNSAQVFRDIYYIAAQRNPGRTFSDYAFDRQAMLAEVPDPSQRARLRNVSEIVSSIYGHPEWWSQTGLFARRGDLSFTLEEEQYFPMGDNSAASSDARVWSQHFVEHEYLLGKALLVFWPHTWNTPLPFTPNIKRMGMIR